MERQYVVKGAYRGFIANALLEMTVRLSSADYSGLTFIRLSPKWCLPCRLPVRKARLSQI